MTRALEMNRLSSFTSPARWAELHEEVLTCLDASDLQVNEFGYDKYGVSRKHVALMMTMMAWFYRDYFQVRVHHIDRLQPGAQFLIGNHAGAVGYDGGIAMAAMLLDGRPPRLVRAMVEKFLSSMPLLGVLTARMGGVTGTPDTCLRMLAEGLTVLAYPEGARGTGKGWTHRYRLVDFGTGFVRLALAAHVPIQPFASIGAEEATPGVVQLDGVIAKLMQIPYLPFTPWIVALPRPFPIDLYFGHPIHLKGDPNEEDAPIQRYVDETRGQIQSLISDGLADRA